jgi:hypothetical protein
LDDFCDTRDTLDVGAGEQLHDTMGGFIHILLVVAVIVLVVGLFRRR